MTNKDLVSTPVDLSNQLILVDDDLIEQAIPNVQDLYLQLVREPSFIKKESLKYDYRPSPVVFSPEQDKNVNTQELENFSQIGSKSNSSTRTIKCNCSKTKCQKNYCQCFKAGIACGEQCACIECCNDQISINIKKINSGSGCKCQKSHCMKNYCECHSAGKKCTDQCRCLQCHNLQGQQIGSESQIKKISRPKKKRKVESQIQATQLLQRVGYESRIV